MSSPLQGGSRRRDYRRRRYRRRRLRPGALMAVIVPVAAVVAAWLLLANGGGVVGTSHSSEASVAPVRTQHPPAATSATPGSPFAVTFEQRDLFRLRFKHEPRAGLVFDLESGQVLWRRKPFRRAPIASLTKLMTALLVAEKTRSGEKVLITRDALNYSGSGVGLLPKGRHVTVNALMYGLLLPSGNDAAIALADHVAHSQRRFVAMMNERARSLGLSCTHFASPHGLEDGNRSCAADLAALSRAVLDHRRIARIVRQAHAIVPFPIKGGKLYLNNTNPLLRAGYPGTIGLKTGSTDAAGHCLIAVVRRGPLTLGAVLLASPDPQRQARKLLDTAFRADQA